MKLELKHLTPYLPYGLKCLNQHLPDKEYIIKELKGVAHHIVWSGAFDAKHGTNHVPICGIDPILRPLSDLTKEIEVNGERFVPIVELLKIKHKGWVIKKLNTRYAEIDFSINYNYAQACFVFMATLSIEVWLSNLEIQEYWIIEKLLEWHFDVFGLIDKGLAIDINTI